MTIWQFTIQDREVSHGKRKRKLLTQKGCNEPFKAPDPPWIRCFFIVHLFYKLTNNVLRLYSGDNECSKKNENSNESPVMFG